MKIAIIVLAVIAIIAIINCILLGMAMKVIGVYLEKIDRHPTKKELNACAEEVVDKIIPGK